MKADMATMAADVLQELEDVETKELQQGVAVRLSMYLDERQVEKLQEQLNGQGYHRYEVKHLRGERRVRYCNQ